MLIARLLACSTLKRLPLLTRCASTSQPEHDRIHLRGMTFFGFHGVLDHETRLGQRFEVDLTLWCNLHTAGESDNLKHTVNYADVFRCGAALSNMFVQNKRTQGCAGCCGGAAL